MCSTNGPAPADDHVFLRSVAPHIRLADHASVHRVTAETFRKAGVTDVKAGTRLLRHNAASRLLRAAVPLPTISAVLGHASQESTNLYMSVDRRASARVRPAGPRRRAVMSGHGFTSAFAAELDAYLAFKAEHGILRRLPHLVPETGSTPTAPSTTGRVFDQDTVEGWVTAQLATLGPLPVVDVLHP